MIFDLVGDVDGFLLGVGEEEEGAGEKDDEEEGDHEGYEDGQYNFEFHTNAIYYRVESGLIE